MYKRDFIKAAADKAGMSQSDFEKAYDAMVELIQETLSSGDKVQLTGFGTFKTSKRKARKGRNPATGEAISIPAKTVPQFSAGSAFKEAVAKSKKKTKVQAKPKKKKGKVAAAKS